MLAYKLSVNQKETEYTVKVAKTFFKRLAGLLGKRLLSNECLLITKCGSIHTFFMRFNIDAVFLGRDNLIVKKVSSLKPWRIVLPVPGTESVLELPEGTCEKLSLVKGDEVTVK